VWACMYALTAVADSGSSWFQLARCRKLQFRYVHARPRVTKSRQIRMSRVPPFSLTSMLMGGGVGLEHVNMPLPSRLVISSFDMLPPFDGVTVFGWSLLCRLSEGDDMVPSWRRLRELVSPVVSPMRWPTLTEVRHTGFKAESSWALTTLMLLQQTSCSALTLKWLRGP
jgi:hypothetical protein